MNKGSSTVLDVGAYMRLMPDVMATIQLDVQRDMPFAAQVACCKACVRSHSSLLS